MRTKPFTIRRTAPTAYLDMMPMAYFCINDGVEYYYPDARIAFNHGEPDGSSLDAVDQLHVVKVIPEVITLHGQSSYGSRAGFFDRRTGHGEITWYQKYGKGEFWIGGEPDETVAKQWLFECKPSAPAKF
jgi:hypothetical protein